MQDAVSGSPQQFIDYMHGKVSLPNVLQFGVSISPHLCIQSPQGGGRWLWIEAQATAAWGLSVDEESCHPVGKDIPAQAVTILYAISIDVPVLLSPSTALSGRGAQSASQMDQGDGPEGSAPAQDTGNGPGVMGGLPLWGSLQHGGGAKTPM